MAEYRAERQLTLSPRGNAMRLKTPSRLAVDAPADTSAARDNARGSTVEYTASRLSIGCAGRSPPCRLTPLHDSALPRSDALDHLLGRRFLRRRRIKRRRAICA